MRLGILLQLGQLGLQGEAELVEAVAPLPAPVLVAVRRQQLGVEALEGRAIGAGLALLARRGGELFKGDRVDPDRVLGAEQDQFFAQLQVAAAVQPDRVESAPGREYRLMEVVAGGVRVPPRPQQLGGLVDVEATLGREGEQLDQRLRLAQPPGVVGDDAVAGADGEHPEETDAQHVIAHRCAFRAGTRHRIRKLLRSDRRAAKAPGIGFRGSSPPDPRGRGPITGGYVVHIVMRPTKMVMRVFSLSP